MMGNTEDGVFLITTIFASALMLGLGYYLITTLISFPQFAGATANTVKDSFTYLDGLIALGAVLLFAASAILAYFLPTHPAFFFSWILTAIMAFVISPIYSNLYAQVAQLSVFGTSFDAFPLTALLVGNLPILSLLLITLIALVSYGKRFNPASLASL